MLFRKGNLSLTIYIIISILIFILLAVIITSYVCFRMAFYVTKKQKIKNNNLLIPHGRIYEPHREQMLQWIDELKKIPCIEYSIKSFDGLTLCAKYYEYQKDAPVELMFHGYRGKGDRDLCGGVQRCFALGRSAFIVDQRTAGKSEGSVISFGINESRDCLDWVDFIIKTFGNDVKIILTGISMGASTVMIAAGEQLPSNVIGVLADCGFTSAKEIIMLVIKQMNMPAELLYPFVKLGAKLFGKFDLERKTSIEGVAKSKIPVIFIHGEDDDFVPCDMSIRAYQKCNSPKKLVTFKGAGHGLAYIIDRELYMKSVREFDEVIKI